MEASKGTTLKLDKSTVLITVAAYVLSIAFQYGIFTARISSLEQDIQSMQTDIHEIRNHVWLTSGK